MSKTDGIEELLEATAMVSLEDRLGIIVERQIAKGTNNLLNAIVSNIEMIICHKAVKVSGSKWRAAKALGIDYKTLKRKVS